MSSFQKKMSDKTGSKPGMEFKRAVELAEERGAAVVMADRNIGTTLKRAWRVTRFLDKLKMMASLVIGKNEDLEEVDIEELKSMDAINSMVESFAEGLPDAKRVLIDERDAYLTGNIQENLGRRRLPLWVPGMYRGCWSFSRHGW